MAAVNGNSVKSKSRPTASRPLRPFDPQQWEALGRLGQCLIAFGNGAGPIRIRVEAVQTLYRRLWRPFVDQANPRPVRGRIPRLGWLDRRDYLKNPTVGQESDYCNHAAQITDLCRAVGRLAASMATNEGSFAIDEKHAREALEHVITHLGEKTLEDERTRGAYCIPPDVAKKRR